MPQNRRVEAAFHLPARSHHGTFRSDFWTVSRLNRLGLHWIRRRQRTFARSVLALFCVVWLQAALAPCAMAVGPGQAAAAQEEHCPYCPPAHERPDSPAGQAGAGTCAYPDKPQSDTRATNAAFAAWPALPVVLIVAPVASVGRPLGLEHLRPPADTLTPLAVSYCRFLE
jgi:hypothetical protein